MLRVAWKIFRWSKGIYLSVYLLNKVLSVILTGTEMVEKRP